MGRVLIACEESQAVTKEFRLLGHEAYSCDIIETSGDKPEWHLQQDVIPLLAQEWDLIIAFPPCTYLTVSGNAWFNVEKYGRKARKRHRDRKRAVDFFMAFANAKCDKVAIENPIGHMSTAWRKPDHIIEPWMWGDLATKKTCLWLKGLPKLIPDTTEKPELEYVSYGKNNRMQKWMYDIRCTTVEDGKRAKLASKTFPGIANAMATQWGALI